MEESLTDMMIYLKEQFNLPSVDIKSYSPLVLAYIGDSVFEVIIRTLLVGRGNAQAKQLHKKASTLVNAAAQSALLERIKETLTEEEFSVFKRGRNAHSGTMAKHATVSDYRKATGLEALVGYLYLKGEFKRIVDLVKLGLEETI